MYRHEMRRANHTNVCDWESETWCAPSGFCFKKRKTVNSGVARVVYRFLCRKSLRGLRS